MIVIGLILMVGPTIISLQSVEYIQIQTSSPVIEGQVCSIDVSIKTGVGVSGIANLFIDEVFLQSVGGNAGSDGVMYFSTGWVAVGVGDHVLRVCYFEDGYPTQSFEASTVITVTDSTVPPDDNPPDDNPPEFPEALALPIQLVGVVIAGFGGYNYFIRKKTS